MKGIQKSDGGRWSWMGSSYMGLSETDAQDVIAQLRRWAREDKSGLRYRIMDVATVRDGDVEIALTGQAEPANHPAPDDDLWVTDGIDGDGHRYRVYWRETSDGANACDWDNPVKITRC